MPQEVFKDSTYDNNGSRYNGIRNMDGDFKLLL